MEFKFKAQSSWICNSTNCNKISFLIFKVIFLINLVHKLLEAANSLGDWKQRLFQDMEEILRIFSVFIFRF